MSGGAIICAGACVCWFSRTQKSVTLSTSEAEYVALGDAVKELLFLRQVWRFMIPGKGMPCFSVFEDNQGAATLEESGVELKLETHRCSSSFLERGCPPGGRHRKSCSF